MFMEVAPSPMVWVSFIPQNVHPGPSPIEFTRGSKVGNDASTADANDTVAFVRNVESMGVVHSDNQSDSNNCGVLAVSGGATTKPNSYIE